MRQKGILSLSFFYIPQRIIMSHSEGSRKPEFTRRKWICKLFLDSHREFCKPHLSASPAQFPPKLCQKPSAWLLQVLALSFQYPPMLTDDKGGWNLAPSLIPHRMSGTQEHRHWHTERANTHKLQTSKNSPVPVCSPAPLASIKSLW